MVERDRGMNSNIIIHYFKLRSKQLFRILKEWGITKPVFVRTSFFSILYVDKGKTKLDSASGRNLRIDRLS